MKPKEKPNLNAYEFLELSEHTKAERLELFYEALHQMSGKGFFTPEETKLILASLPKWLDELLEN